MTVNKSCKYTLDVQTIHKTCKCTDSRQSIINTKDFHFTTEHSRDRFPTRDFQLSLNRRDALSGDDQTLDAFGIVSGDLLHIIGHNLPGVSLRCHL